MFFNLKRRVLRVAVSFFLPLTLSLALQANEAAAPAKPKAPASTTAGGDKPWVNIQNQVLVLKTRRMQLKQNMAALKDHGAHPGRKAKPDSKHIKEEVDSLVKLYKEYKEVTEEYNKLLVVLKYRYPERLAKEEAREYKAVEVESLEALEAQLDIEGRLSKVYKKAQTQYSPPKERQPASVEPLMPKKENGPGGNTIREQDPILLSQ